MQKKNQNISVYHIGPSPTARGGIATVVSLLLNLTIEDIEQRHLTSHHTKLWRTLIHFPPLIVRLFFIKKQKSIVQLHLSYKGSSIRKYLISLILRFRKMPYIVHLHGGAFAYHYDRSSSFMSDRIDDLFRYSKKNVVLAEYWRQELKKRLKYDCFIDVIPNPSAVIQEPTAKKSVIRILYAGYVAPAKGSFDLLEAFARANLSGVATLELCGNGEVEQLRQRVVELNLEKSVSVPGWIDHREMVERMRYADVFVLPSYFEGLPMVILEAMGSALPVISTPVGGIAEAVVDGETGLLVTPGDIEALSIALKKLAGDQELRNKMGKAGQQRVKEHFSLEKFSEQFELLWRSAIQ